MVCTPDYTAMKPVQGQLQSARLGVDALLVQEAEDADAPRRPRLDEVDALLVVLEVHVRPVDALRRVHLLLQLEQVPAKGRHDD